METESVSKVSNARLLMVGVDSSEVPVLAARLRRWGHDGIGLTPESVREIFTAGYTTKESGTGLGLHSAANFVVGSGGTIEPLSEGIGRGTTMRVRLRLSRDTGRPGGPARG